jgi:hypothetical protein
MLSYTIRCCSWDAYGSYVGVCGGGEFNLYKINTSTSEASEGKSKACFCIDSTLGKSNQNHGVYAELRSLVGVSGGTKYIGYTETPFRVSLGNSASIEREPLNMVIGMTRKSQVPPRDEKRAKTIEVEATELDAEIRSGSHSIAVGTTAPAASSSVSLFLSGPASPSVGILDSLMSISKSQSQQQNPTVLSVTDSSKKITPASNCGESGASSSLSKALRFGLTGNRMASVENSRLSVEEDRALNTYFSCPDLLAFLPGDGNGGLLAVGSSSPTPSGEEHPVVDIFTLGGSETKPVPEKTRLQIPLPPSSRTVGLHFCMHEVPAAYLLVQALVPVADVKSGHDVKMEVGFLHTGLSGSFDVMLVVCDVSTLMSTGNTTTASKRTGVKSSPQDDFAGVIGLIERMSLRMEARMDHVEVLLFFFVEI